MDYPKFIVLNQKEEFISMQRVNRAFWANVISNKIYYADSLLLSCKIE